ncbi:alpha-L-fucosidase [Rhodocytophaga aerolata]|uniref:alpha-L-fucosidase n=1 Tax=Rhodocytophaga aerolata TaxID=455078 RepID=A0ABT8R7H3_9BACT|nr:alpha-L-fucosidase [Rhodocytophaga aerolata]MDO1448055.1 alpha-L-fucosidase [Rhodocytophaga aerolata]
MNLLRPRFSIFFFLLLFCRFQTSAQKSPPAPFGATPSPQQLDWHKMEYYAFAHFNMNTFTDEEWGHGTESPSAFNPTQLDCRQWAKVAKEAGMKGIIITAKHHDGFCLWPSQYTQHSVKNSSWKNGKGDVLRELSDACKEYGLKFGVYLSPWDRNHPAYGTAEYNEIFKKTLEEVLTNYGDVFEVWFDGANGEGPNGKKQVYDWPGFIATVYKYQPKAIIFSDAGPGCRWVGNEEGIAGETNWATLNGDKVYPGYEKYQELTPGHEDGTHWIPAETDVSIRPGWYYHQSEDHKVKSLTHMVDIYYKSLGRGSNLLLNLPIDRRGLVHENDVQRLKELKAVIDADFSTNLAKGKKVTASQERDKEVFAAANVVDGDDTTYWATADGTHKGSVEVDLGKATEINRFVVQEYIKLGQRVKSFSVEAFTNGAWKEIAKGTTIGYKRILRFPTISASKVRVTILEAKASPLITNVELYHAPALLAAPEINRTKEGVVSLRAPDTGVTLYYTTDGSEPNKQSKKYKASFPLQTKATLKALAIDASGKQSPVSRMDFDIAKKKWKVISTQAVAYKNIAKLIDDDPETGWSSRTKDNSLPFPCEVVIDLGEELALEGFTYLPLQGRNIEGTIAQYEFYVSQDGKSWGKPVSSGEFSNIKNNPVLQTKHFTQVKARFIKLKALTEIHNKNFASFAEIGVLTTK